MSHIPESWMKDQERIWTLADQDNCDGYCDRAFPYKRCPECLARSVINECGELFGDVLREIDLFKTQEHKETF